MIYTAPCVRFLMRADRLRGEGDGGWRWKSRVLWAARAIWPPPHLRYSSIIYLIRNQQESVT
jgi:hypothetical protein